MNIYIDIETVARTDIPDEYLKVDSRLKDPDKIEDAKLKSAEKSVFDGAFGEVVSIAYAVNDGKVKTYRRDDNITETDILELFFKDLHSDIDFERDFANNREYELKWTGHNIQFDLGFLFKRTVILNIDRKVSLPWPCNAWDRRINDTMYMWAGRDTVSLDKLAFVILGEAKTTTGADVAGMWARGEYDKIAAYNADDVEKTRAIYKRMTQ